LSNQAINIVIRQAELLVEEWWESTPCFGIWKVHASNEIVLPPQK